MKIEFLNHASIAITCGNVSLLTDPWYTGTCFEEGWGLRFNNPQALERAATCTHLWISHFHADHFHAPTLRLLAKANPDILCLANRSSNFEVKPALARFGFRNIVELKERTDFSLSDQIRVIRYPATGIDNMLFMETPEGNVLNFNDCNLPLSTIRKIVAKFPKVDILLTNFNVAEKWLDPDCQSPEAIKARLKQRLKKIVDAVNPKIVVPFASHHYFRSADSVAQNDLLMTSDELVAVDSRVLPLKIGECIEYRRDEAPRVIAPAVPVRENAYEVYAPQETVTAADLLNAAELFQRQTKRHFLGVVGWLQTLRIRIPDLNQTLVLNPKAKPTFKTEAEGCHIATHSKNLLTWFTKPYGTDSFFVGAHFALLTRQVSPIRRLMLARLLIENRMDPVSLMKQFLLGSGWLHLFNRREELQSILISRKFAIGSGARE